MRMIKFKMPLFPSTIKIFFCLEDYLNMYPSERTNRFEHYNAFVQEQRDGICLVIINYSDKLLAHESVHAAWAVLNYVGVKVDYYNDEPLAYCVDYIFGKVQEHRRKELAKCD